jgi:DNA-binding Lrp family transcriptional regulator
MVKPKDKPEAEIRTPGPKRKSIIPASFQIRRADNPMRSILDESEGKGPVLEASLPQQTSLAIKTSQDLDQSPDRTKTSLVTKTRLDNEANQRKSSLDLMASLPDVKGFLKLYFQLIDHLYPQLDPFERAVHETLYRLSWGFNKPSCSISYQRIAERTGMSAKSAQRAIGRLEQKGLISKSSRVIGYQKEQGIEFSVVPPPRQVSESRQGAQSRQDSQTNIIDTTTQIENTQTQVLSVSSRFSLEECRQYAEHLQKTGQGINNPGGYATKIYRSGEVDGMIDAFLHPASQKPQTCPLCALTNGLVYVDKSNMDKGMVKCRHEQV